MRPLLLCFTWRRRRWRRCHPLRRLRVRLAVSASLLNGLAEVPFAPVGVEFFLKSRHADASRNREEWRGRCGGTLCRRAQGSTPNAGQNHDFRESFDVAAARAVAELKILAEYCLPLVRVGGLFIAAKGHDPHEEIRSAKAAVGKLGASMLDLCNVESMGPHGQRTAVVYLKERTTPKKYPRQPGTPSKTPL